MTTQVSYDEKELVLEYKQKREHYDRLKQLCSESYKDLEETIQKLVVHLEEAGATSTAKYEGIGRVTLATPQLYAKFDEENRGHVFDYLRQKGMESVIKETVHHSTFSSFVASLVKDGHAIPEFIQTTYKKNIRFQK